MDLNDPITLADVLEARKHIGPLLQPTPLRSYPALDEAVGLHVLVKHENHLPTNSFKVRNGLSLISRLTAEEKGRGVVAATRGNHGLGLAWAGRHFGVEVTICVPLGNNPEKNRDLRGLGARVIESGANYDEACLMMQQLVQEEGLLPAHSTNDTNIIAGAATLTLEIVEQADAMGEKLGAVVMAIGGGSQAVGAITVLQQLLPHVEVYGVQAEQAAAIYDSWRSGRQVTHASADTIADGLASRMPYELTFPALCQGLKNFVTVSEQQLADAVRLMISATHNLAEAAGAAGLAGLRLLAPELQGKTVAIVLSGSNIDQDVLRRITTCEL